MKIKIDATYLITIFKSLNEITSEVNLKFNSEGLKIFEFCPSNVSLIDINLKKDVFTLYEITEEKNYNVNVDNFLEIIKDLKKTEVTITDTEKSLILDYNCFKSEIFLTERMNDIKTEFPYLFFDSEIRINSKKLNEVIKTLSKLSESIGIEILNNEVLIYSRDTTKTEIKFNSDDVFIQTKGNLKSIYSSEYLIKFIKNNISENIILKLSDSQPLSFEKDTPYFKIKYILAPRICED